MDRTHQVLQLPVPPSPLSVPVSTSSVNYPAPYKPPAAPMCATREPGPTEQQAPRVDQQGMLRSREQTNPYTAPFHFLNPSPVEFETPWPITQSRLIKMTLPVIKPKPVKPKMPPIKLEPCVTRSAAQKQESSGLRWSQREFKLPNHLKVEDNKSNASYVAFDSFHNKMGMWSPMAFIATETLDPFSPSHVDPAVYVASRKDSVLEIDQLVMWIAGDLG